MMAHTDPGAGSVVLQVLAESRSGSPALLGEAVLDLHAVLDACRDLTHHTLDVMAPGASGPVGRVVVSVRAYAALTDIMGYG